MNSSYIVWGIWVINNLSAISYREIQRDCDDAYFVFYQHFEVGFLIPGQWHNHQQVDSHIMSKLPVIQYLLKNTARLADNQLMPYLVIGLIKLGTNSTNFHIQDENANHYYIEAVRGKRWNYDIMGRKLTIRKLINSK